MAVIERLDFLGVPSQDPVRARAFYRDVLGMRPDAHAEWEQWAGDTCFGIWEPEKQGMPFVAQKGNPWPLRCDDVAQMRAVLEAKGVEFFGDTFDTGGCQTPHCLGTRICARAPLWKRSSSRTSNFRCCFSSANGLWPAPIAIGTVVSWYSSTRPRWVSDLAKSGPPWTRIVPSSSRALSSAIAAPSSPPKISAGPHSAFSRVREKTAFGFVFIAVAIGPSDAAQCGPMIS